MNDFTFENAVKIKERINVLKDNIWVLECQANLCIGNTSDIQRRTFKITIEDPNSATEQIIITGYEAYQIASTKLQKLRDEKKILEDEFCKL